MAMRGIDVQPRDLFSYIQLEQRVPSKHPLRAIRKMVDVALSEMDCKRPVKPPVVFRLREARCDFTRRSRKWGRALCGPSPLVGAQGVGVLKERAFGIEKG